MTHVVVNFWGGARSAAGRESEEVEAASPAEVLAELRSRHPDAGFAAVLSACSVLVDGVALRPDQLDRPFPTGSERSEQSGPCTVELLPPFAGG